MNITCLLQIVSFLERLTQKRLKCKAVDSFHKELTNLIKRDGHARQMQFGLGVFDSGTRILFNEYAIFAKSDANI